MGAQVPVSWVPPTFPIGTSRELGSLPPLTAVGGLGLATSEETPPNQPETGAVGTNPFAAILPLLTSLPGSMEHADKAVAKLAQYLAAKGLPTLPMKLVEKVWNLDYVDMEEFLPTPRSATTRAGEIVHIPPGI